MISSKLPVLQIRCVIRQKSFAKDLANQQQRSPRQAASDQNLGASSPNLGLTGLRPLLRVGASPAPLPKTVGPRPGKPYEVQSSQQGCPSTMWTGLCTGFEPICLVQVAWDPRLYEDLVSMTRIETSRSLFDLPCAQKHLVLHVVLLEIALLRCIQQCLRQTALARSLLQ